MLAAASLVVATSAANAEAAGSKPVGGARALAVSVPPDPVPIKAGSSANTLVRVVNPNDAPITVTIAGREISLLDNGKVSVGRGPDPRWQRFIRLPTGELTVPAQSYLEVQLTIHVPRRLAPDLYFIGFLVTPIATGSGSLKVINQIGSFVTIDVPGPRVRNIAATFDVPSFVLASHVRGNLRIANTGRAAVRFWGENDTNSSPGGSFEQHRLDTSLLPTGTSRYVSVSGKPAWPVGIVSMTVHLTYPGRTEVMTKELILRKRVLVVSPWVLVALAVLLLSGGGVFWRAGRRRASQRT